MGHNNDIVLNLEETNTITPLPKKKNRSYFNNFNIRNV